MSYNLKVRINGDTKEDVTRCLEHIIASIQTGETSGDSDDDTSDIDWDIEEQEDEDDDEGLGNQEYVLGVTLRRTTHGMIGGGTLPEGVTVALVTAHNQPQPGDTQYWAYPAPGHPWDFPSGSNLVNYANGYGIGLADADVEIIK